MHEDEATKRSLNIKELDTTTLSIALTDYVFLFVQNN